MARTKEIDVKLDDREAATAYVAPAADGGRGGVVVIHEIEGLTPHFADLCDRLAGAGYSAIAPDLFARDPEISCAARAGDYGSALQRIYRLGAERLVEDLRAARNTLVTTCCAEPHRVAVLGFCVGGYLALLAATEPAGGWAAAASFYGPPAGYAALGMAEEPNPLARAASIACPALLFYGRRDDLIPTWHPVEFAARARRAGGTVEVVLEDAGHAFFNDTRDTYRPAAAEHSWTELLAFLGQTLNGEQ